MSSANCRIFTDGEGHTGALIGEPIASASHRPGPSFSLAAATDLAVEGVGQGIFWSTCAVRRAF